MLSSLDLILTGDAPQPKGSVLVTYHAPGLFQPKRRAACFSYDRKYRYQLWCVWDPSKPPINFLMLNPSTADEKKNDATVERCERRARALGYGGFVITNLFAFRATDPDDMKAAPDPVGVYNDQKIIEAAKASALIVCAWGNDGSFLGRSRRVRRLLRQERLQLHCFRTTNTGEPGHPLYLPYSQQPIRWR